MTETRIRYIAWSAVGLVLVLLPLVLPRYSTYVATMILIYAIYAMSLDVLLGYLGYTSFGHAAYFATGAYAAVIGATRFGLSGTLLILVALGAVLIVALAFGAVALRTSGLPFIMITLALGQALWGLAYRWASVTGGDNGISGLARPTLPFVGSLTEPHAYYYFVLAIFAVAAGLLALVTYSPLGLSWRGIRDSELRMLALGYNTWLHKYLAYVISALFGGLAGILHAYLIGFVSPEVAFLTNSATAILMVILGGPGTLAGPCLGSAVIILIRQMVSSVIERWLIVLGLVYIGTVVFLPGGLLGLARQAFERIWIPRERGS